MMKNQSIEAPTQRGHIPSASIFFSVGLVPASLFIWLSIHTHNFRDVSANSRVAAEASLNFFGMLAGFLLSSVLIGKVAAPFIKIRRGLRLFALLALLGSLWSLLTLSGSWVALALHGLMSNDFAWLRHAFAPDELLSGLIGFPILLHIPLTLLSAFLVRKLVFGPRSTA